MSTSTSTSKTSPGTIRPFTEADYDVVARLFNSNFAPEFEKAPNEIRFDDEHRPAHIKSGRWIVEHDGQAVAYASYGQRAHAYHPRKFQLTIAVDPRWQLRGIGRRLYELLIDALRPFDPESVDEWSREDMTCRRGFLERRGFVEDMRMWSSALDLTTFDPSRFAHLVPPVTAQGLQLTTLAELGPSDPDVLRRLYDLWSEIRDDVPSPPSEVPSDVSFEEWKEYGDRPTLWPNGYYVAVDGDRYVGESQLWLAPEADALRTGLTGTRRAYRRRGIAYALKVLALTRGKQRGYRWVHTENEARNVGMLAINEALGFVKKPIWIHLAKRF